MSFNVQLLWKKHTSFLIIDVVTSLSTVTLQASFTEKCLEQRTKTSAFITIRQRTLFSISHDIVTASKTSRKLRLADNDVTTLSKIIKLIQWNPHGRIHTIHLQHFISKNHLNVVVSRSYLRNNLPWQRKNLTIYITTATSVIKVMIVMATAGLMNFPVVTSFIIVTKALIRKTATITWKLAYLYLGTRKSQVDTTASWKMAHLHLHFKGEFIAWRIFFKTHVKVHIFQNLSESRYINLAHKYFLDRSIYVLGADLYFTLILALYPGSKENFWQISGSAGATKFDVCAKSYSKILLWAFGIQQLSDRWIITN